MATDALTDQRERTIRERSRWLTLAVVGIGFAAVVTALTAINVALPSAQRAMHFTTADRQWVVTAYTLAFGCLLLAGGRLVDLLGKKTMFLAGLLGFAGVSAVGGASVNFGMLVAARAFQGAFAALLVPSALSLLSTTFTDPKERARAFGIFGAIATAGGAVGLLIGGRLPSTSRGGGPSTSTSSLQELRSSAGRLCWPGCPRPPRPGSTFPVYCCRPRACSQSFTDSGTQPHTVGGIRPPGDSLSPERHCSRFSRYGWGAPRTRCCRHE